MLLEKVACVLFITLPKASFSDSVLVRTDDFPSFPSTTKKMLLRASSENLRGKDTIITILTHLLHIH